jgi:hypothetical protein
MIKNYNIYLILSLIIYTVNRGDIDFSLIILLTVDMATLIKINFFFYDLVKLYNTKLLIVDKTMLSLCRYRNKLKTKFCF